MKTLLIALALLGLNPSERNVFICNTKTAVAYHLKKDCTGLQKCKGTISEVTESAAKGRGLHLCGWED